LPENRPITSLPARLIRAQALLPGMKILQINTEKTWRGGERQTLLTMKGLIRERLDARLLCLDGHPLAQKSKELMLPVIPVKNQVAAYKFLLAHGRDYDLLHAQTSRAQSLAVLSKPGHRRRVVYTRRVDFRPKGTAARFKYLFTDQVVAISGAIKQILAESLPGKETLVIGSCIDTTRDLLPPASKALELKKDLGNRKIIASAAALVPHKDPLTMVRAVARLRRNAAQNFVFLHFGQGELEDEVRREILHLHLDKEYLLMGFENNLEGFFPVFDLFVMSSSEEGLGSSVLEAFRYRVPVVSTMAGGLEELVQGRGLLCPVGDCMCLARRMNQILRSPDMFRDLVQDAHAYVLEKHSLEEMTRQYILLYHKMMS